jgi:hypothetical protein
MRKLVNFVSHGNEHLASHRFRAEAPVKFLNKYCKDSITAILSEEPDEGADILVFQKHLQPEKDKKFVTHSCESQTVVFDICDDHFDRDARAHYLWMCDNADIITCPNERMAKRIHEVTLINPSRIRVVPDPINLPIAEVKNPSMNPKFLWHGHASNLSAIVPFIRTLPNLTIMTNGIQEENLTDTCKTVLWTPTKLQETIKDYDVVLIPTPQDSFVQYKSPNRAIDALAAGKFVITDNSSIYGELKDYIFIGDIDEGIKFYLGYPKKAQEMIRLGQHYVFNQYKDKEIARLWKENLTEHLEVPK